jgi:hypothetical protein
LRRDPPVRVEVLEHQHILIRLVAHIVELLLRIVLQIHGRAHVLPANVVRFDQIGARDCAAGADGKGVVLYDAGEGPPDAECSGWLGELGRGGGKRRNGTYLMTRMRPWNRNSASSFSWSWIRRRTAEGLWSSVSSQKRILTEGPPV